ncbi:proteasome assembly chaperone 2 [Chelonus insularis]|uniref:proteasome assembly chaperone 2 n=1 Tax=Chelonus insularis TaxID=460826 RepID=UPI00158E5866|nr:proteasome assembly chaperone 2 [Chelonus insularis]
MIKLIEKIDLSGGTLIVPAVAVGNVGQLAIDLLICSLEMKRIGHLINSCFIPVLGTDPYNEYSNELCTSCDIYYEAKKKIVALQIRSPPVKDLKSFFDELKEFISNQKISQVIILTSSWAHTRTDVQIRSEPMRYVASPAIEKNFESKFQKLNWLKLEPIINPEDDRQRFQISGGGFAAKLFNFFFENQIPCLILLRFCSEGDNIEDAVVSLSYLDKWLEYGISSTGPILLKHPHSWASLFGNPAPDEIY